MVALASWIEPEETADAAASSRPGESDPYPENRVWDFFGPSPDRVGETEPQVVDCDWEILFLIYDPRRGPSLARRGDSQPIGDSTPREITEMLAEQNPGSVIIHRRTPMAV